MGEEVATPTEKKSYYAIIPANVRYDKRLKANAKLLYGEITALCNEKGYCWANNNYFSNLYEVSVTSISKWISQLHEYGYIRVIIKAEEGNKRYIYINNNVPIEEKFKTSLTKVQDLINESSRPIEEKFKHNNTTNTTNNNTNNTNDNEDKPRKCKKSNIDKSLIESIWSMYPRKQGKADAIKKIPKLIEKYGYEQIVRCVERYNDYISSNNTDTKYVKHGSTFFNSAYFDYLDENYVKQKTWRDLVFGEEDTKEEVKPKEAVKYVFDPATKTRITIEYALSHNIDYIEAPEA